MRFNFYVSLLICANITEVFTWIMLLSKFSEEGVCLQSCGIYFAVQNVSGTVQRKESFCVWVEKCGYFWNVRPTHCHLHCFNQFQHTSRAFEINTIFNRMKMWCHVWIQRKWFKWLFVLWRVSFSFLSFPKFNCLLTYIKCALFSMRVVYRCFMLFSYLHWTPKKGLTELYFDELRTSKWKRCKCCCAMDEFRHISLSASKTSNECCLGSYEYACQMYSHYKRIHWFDISFDGISGFLFLDCANCYEPYFICEREQQPSNKF